MAYIEHDEKLKVLDWPAKCSALNPTESLWSTLDGKLMRTPVYNKATLRKRLEKELGIGLYRSLIDSMPERRKSVCEPRVDISVSFFFLEKKIGVLQLFSANEKRFTVK